MNNTENKNGTVIIFAHGNSTDLGQMLPLWLEISVSLEIDIFA